MRNDPAAPPHHHHQKHASRFLVSLGKKRKLVKFPIIHLTTDSLNKKYFVILQQGEAVTVVSTSSMGKNAELKEINVNSDRSQVSSICKKSQGKDSITCAPLCRFYSSTSKIVGTDVVDFLKVFARDAKLGRNDQ